MMKTASYRQLDLTLMFLAGLVGNTKNDAFLRSLGMLNLKIAVDVLIKLVVERERRNEANLEDQKQAAAHRSSTLLLLLLIYESQQRDLWHHVSHYILLKEGTELNLYCQHVSPVEIQAVLFILPMCVDITVLNLDNCNLTGKDMKSLASAVIHLTQLTKLNFAKNNLHCTATIAALTKSLVKLSRLELLGLGICELSNEDVATLATAITSISTLKELWLPHNAIDDASVDTVIRVIGALPRLEQLGLADNYISETQVERIRDAAKQTPKLYCQLLDVQRLPGVKVESDPVLWRQQVLVRVESLLQRLQSQGADQRDVQALEFYQRLIQGELLHHQSQRDQRAAAPAVHRVT